MNVEKLISEELQKALVKFPEATNSSHEGFAVLMEEIDELQEEFDLLKTQNETLWKNVKKDNYIQQRIQLIEMKQTVYNLIKEAVQVGAMIEKWNNSLINL